ncbi:hypothetical protein LTR37_001367 [Vermiconidia calcicola]|uniref:Uncharacterized protein n=1 Tax=Vermiconidia calcicola TaxID=1690605 RepID=A0ACC3NVC8_9PEZI|nr:hypothetical protein LTR37_001367 [Vermiconidia calcicola]
MKRLYIEKEGHPGPDYSDMWSWVCTEAHKHTGKAARSACREELKRVVPIPDAQRLRHYNYRQAMHIYIGPERARAAFRGSFAESTTVFVELPQETVKDFTLFIHWLYTGDIRCLTREEHQQYQDYQSVLSRGCLANLDPDEQTNGSGLTTPDAKGPAAEGQSKTPPASPSSRTDIADRSLLGSDKPNDGGLVLNSVPRAATMGSAEVLPDDRHCKVDASLGSSNEEKECFTTFAQRVQDDIVSLYIFADRREIPGLRNKIINALAGCRESGWPLLSTTERINLAYSALPPNSALCKYLAAEAAWMWDQDFGDTNDLEDLPAEFSARAMRLFLSRTSALGGAPVAKAADSRPWWRYDLCFAHDHENEDAKIACKEEMKDFYVAMLSRGPQMEPVKVDFDV